jgi:hypothetical protein
MYRINFLEANFTRQADPRHLENWIALNEARILSWVTHHQQHNRRVSEALKNTFRPSHNPAPLLAVLYLQFTLEKFCLLSFLLVASLIREPGMVVEIFSHT